MKRLFWLSAGAALGVFGYRYYQRQGRQIPGLDRLGESGRRLQDSGRDFVDAGKTFVDQGKNLAQAAADTAQVAKDTAQASGQQLKDKASTRREEVRDDVGTNSGT